MRSIGNTDCYSLKVCCLKMFSTTQFSLLFLFYSHSSSQHRSRMKPLHFFHNIIEIALLISKQYYYFSWKLYLSCLFCSQFSENFCLPNSKQNSLLYFTAFYGVGSSKSKLCHICSYKWVSKDYRTCGNVFFFFKFF